MRQDYAHFIRIFYSYPIIFHFFQTTSGLLSQFSSTRLTKNRKNEK